MGPRAGMVGCGKSRLLRASTPKPPARRESLYGYFIPVHNILKKFTSHLKPIYLSQFTGTLTAMLNIVTGRMA